MRPPRFRIRTLMIIVAVSALVAWGLVRFPGLDHNRASIVLGILLGAASWVVPLVAVCVISRHDARRSRRPAAPAPPEPE